MVERGLIERVPGPGRAVHHRLTHKGLELRRAGEQIVDEVLARSFAHLSGEQLKAFDDTLRQLLSTPMNGNAI
jgi:DNA-binding MarR family transcriptional regulator